jgi:hypothetical protein
LTASLAAAVDDLYRDVVLDPERWSELAFAEWLEAISLDADAIDRDQAQQLRRAVRQAIKLQAFWSDADVKRKRAEPSWRARVDIAVGVPAWRPPLELATQELYAHPSPERFDEVRERFRVVTGTPWLEGQTYESWAESGRRDAR